MPKKVKILWEIGVLTNAFCIAFLWGEAGCSAGVLTLSSGVGSVGKVILPSRVSLGSDGFSRDRLDELGVCDAISNWSFKAGGIPREIRE